MYRTDSEHDFKTLMKQKWALVVLNVISFMTGLGIFSVCIWIRFDLDFREWVQEIDWCVVHYCFSNTVKTRFNDSRFSVKTRFSEQFGYYRINLHVENFTRFNEQFGGEGEGEFTKSSFDYYSYIADM